MNALTPAFLEEATRAISTPAPGTSDAVLINLGVRYEAAVAAHRAGPTGISDEGERIADDLHSAMHKLERQIEQLSATTTPGLLVKAAAVARMHDTLHGDEDDGYSRAVIGLLDGVKAVAEGLRPATHPDAELLDLGRRFREALALESVAWEALPVGACDEHPDHLAALKLNYATGSVVDLIAACRAATDAGLGVKFRAAAWFKFHGATEAELATAAIDPFGATDDSIFASMALDILAMDARRAGAV